MSAALDFSFLRGAPVAVLGLGKSGLATARALMASGVAVRAWDDSPVSRRAADAEHITLADLGSANLGSMQMLVLSPGIPHSFPEPHPVAARAKAAKRPIIGDIELLYRAQPKSRYVGITGTNGKSTTTALIGHVLSEAGLKIAVGGNLGTPALTFPPLGPDGVYVLEMSSYQLELIDTLAFDVAILLNITPDHLDRHGGMDGYIAAKERIFARQSPKQAAVICIDSAPCRGIVQRLMQKTGGGRLVPISVEHAAKGGVYVRDGKLIDDLDRAAKAELDLTSLSRLPGAHNWQNVLAAYAGARMLGLAPAKIAKAITSFLGLAHRQQLIATIGKVRYVNDSKATNVDAATKALGCYDRIYWIAGGRAKEGGFDDLAPFMPRVAHAFLIGEAAPALESWLKGKAPSTVVGTMDRAVSAAHAAAQADPKGGVVLLSPACASFDQYPNFEVRGRDFADQVAKLGGRS
jgi:UDP-N-acetylmuramoylalanine--D-glutamate ligase